MTDDAPTETKDAPKKKRKAAKKRAKPEAFKTPTDGIYAGLTVHDCCKACNEKGCVISGSSYCAHPRKGGLHGSQQQDEGALKRRRDAEKVLGKQKLIVE